MQLQVYNPQEDEIKRRMAAAKQQGWSDADINKFALIDRAQMSMRQQQSAQQSAQQKQQQQPSGFKRMAAGFLPLALGAIGGTVGTLLEPGGGTAIGGGLGSAAGEALRRKILGEKQSVGATLVEGGLGALPGVGKVISEARTARAAGTGVQTANEVIDASRAAKVAQAAPEGTDLANGAFRTQRSAQQSIAMRQLAKRAGQVGAQAETNPAAGDAAIGALEKRAVANATTPAEQQPGLLSGGWQGIKQKLAERMAENSRPTRTASAGDVLRETQRGTRVGERVPGTSRMLTRENSNAVNDVIDTANQGVFKGGKSLRGQIDKIQQQQPAVYDQLMQATKAANIKLAPEDYTQLDQLVSKHLDDIGDVLDSPAKKALIDKGLNRILYKSDDLVGLEKQRKIFDEGAKRLLQNPDTQGTANAQIQRAYRSAIDEFITAKAPQLKEVKGTYGQLRQAEDLMGVRLKQMEGAQNQGGVLQMLRGSGVKEAGQDIVGRGLQKTGDFMGKLPVRQIKQQGAARLLTGQLGRNMVPPAPSGADQAALNNDGSQAFANPQTIEEQTINQLTAAGITDPEQMAQAYDAITQGGGAGGDLMSQLSGGAAGAGGAGSPGGLSASSTELFNQAVKVLQETGDTKSADELLQMASAAQSLEKQSAASGTSGQPSIGKPTAQQYALANSGTQGVQQLMTLLQKDPGVLSRSATPGQHLPLVGGVVRRGAGTGEYDALANNVIDAILRLRTGAQANKEEIALYRNQLFPQAGDNQKTVQRKLQDLNTAFQPFLGTYSQGSGGDITDLLSSLQSNGGY